MSKSIVTGIVLIATFGLCAAGWWLLPALQGSRRAVETEASVQVERARRLLHKFDAGLAYKSFLVDQLADRGLEVDPDDLSEEVEDEYQQLHQTMWEAYQPTDWRGDRATAARANYANLPRQIRDGLNRRAKLADANDKLLDQALAEVGKALSITRGDESSRTHAEANRLKGVILYHQGLTVWARAQLHRREADRFRRELTALATDAAASESAKTLLADSNIDEQIRLLEAEEDELEDTVSEDREALADLDETIGDLEARLAAAKTRADQARQALDTLKAEGVNFSEPDGAETFRSRLETQDRIYREAVREAHTLEYGTYPNARIDPPVADYLTGRYVENEQTTDLTIRFGLVHYRNERFVLTSKIVRELQALNDLRADIARLVGLKNSYQAAQSRAAEMTTQTVSTASDTYTELNRVEAEAFALEEKALELLDRSARTSQQAAGQADQWVDDAKDRMQGMSPEAKERSAYNHRAGAGWLSGHIAAQEADARLAKAWIYYDRYHASTNNATILTKVVDSLRLNEADPESERSKAQQAHDAGVEEITQAMKILERAHRQAERHWTFAAQAAGTTYLLALFGHDEYVTDAIEAYRNAVKGREDEKFAETFVARLNRLEKR